LTTDLKQSTKAVGEGKTLETILAGETHLGEKQVPAEPWYADENERMTTQWQVRVQ